MNSYFRILITIAIIGILLFSCQRNKNVVQPLSTSSDEFPLAIGSRWVYQATDTSFYLFDPDSIVVQSGLLTLEAVRDTTLANGHKAVIFHEEFLGKKQLLIADTSGNTVRFFSPNYFPSIWFMFIHPLQVGMKWATYSCDSFFVTEKQHHIVPAGFFENTYVIQRRFRCEGNAGLRIFYYFVPHVGLVEYDLDYFVTIHNYRLKRRWKLLRYSVR